MSIWYRTYRIQKPVDAVIPSVNGITRLLDHLLKGYPSFFQFLFWRKESNVSKLFICIWGEVLHELKMLESKKEHWFDVEGTDGVKATRKRRRNDVEMTPKWLVKWLTLTLLSPLLSTIHQIAWWSGLELTLMFQAPIPSSSVCGLTLIPLEIIKFTYNAPGDLKIMSAELSPQMRGRFTSTLLRGDAHDGRNSASFWMGGTAILCWGLQWPPSVCQAVWSSNIHPKIFLKKTQLI
jgi:hypothetical protein